jgi:hypothetical protein
MPLVCFNFNHKASVYSPDTLAGTIPGTAVVKWTTSSDVIAVRRLRALALVFLTALFFAERKLFETGAFRVAFLLTETLWRSLHAGEGSHDAYQVGVVICPQS